MIKKFLPLIVLLLGVTVSASLFFDKNSANEVFSEKLISEYSRDASRTWPIQDRTFALSNYDRQIAKDLLNCGYIIVMRHAHREKWIDVTMYDALELLKNEDGRNSYYADAICLSSQGLPQAKAMGEFVKMVEIPIGKVITSPSCRSRETAELVFGRYDEIKTRLLHYYGDPYGPFNEDAKKHYAEIKEILLSAKPADGVNTIISAHNNTIRGSVIDGVLDENNRPLAEIDWLLEEGGFHVLNERDGI